MGAMQWLVLCLFVWSLFIRSVSCYALSEGSFLDFSHSRQLVQIALLYRGDRDYRNAISYFIKSYHIKEVPILAYYISECYNMLQDTNEYKKWNDIFFDQLKSKDFRSEGFSNNLKLSSLQAETINTLMNRGIDEHYKGRLAIAVDYFLKVKYLLEEYEQSYLILRTSTPYIFCLFHIGVSLMHSGNIHESSLYYQKVLQADPLFVKASINMAYLHHMYGKIEMSMDPYIKAVHTFIGFNYTLVPFFPSYMFKGSNEHNMAELNIAAAYLQMGLYDKSYLIIEKFLNEAKTKNETVCVKQQNINIDCEELRKNIGLATSHLLNLQRKTCSWKSYEATVVYIIQLTLNYDGVTFSPFLSPFDSLLVQISQMDRKKIAINYSDNISGLSSNKRGRVIPQKNLTIGFVSFDFNDHPTAHLIESIFDIIKKKRISMGTYDNVKTILFSYGKDDDSIYRHKLTELADKFIDISMETTLMSQEIISRENLDILLDLQVHTLGARISLFVQHLAPIQINYLVYPGTSGTSFLDYVIVDWQVVPAEHSIFYTEKLVFLSPTYQISYYDRYVIDIVLSKGEKMNLRKN